MPMLLVIVFGGCAMACPQLKIAATNDRKTVSGNERQSLHMNILKLLCLK